MEKMIKSEQVNLSVKARRDRHNTYLLAEQITHIQSYSPQNIDTASV